MTSRMISVTILMSAAIASMACLCQSPADSPDANIGKKIAGFTLNDIDGRPVSSADFKDKKALVVVFLGTQCPINNVFLPRLAELQKEFAPKGVQIVGINSNAQDNAKQVAEHARQFEIPFPILKDDRNKVADRFGAERTPEAFVLDATGAIRYRGRIDDQFGIDYRRPAPTRRDLAVALDEILAGKVVNKPTTEVAGCYIGRVAEEKTDGAVTYSMHVAPIIQNRCQGCHRPGQIGPMPLLAYGDVRGWSSMIREVVQQRRMPPWHADPRVGKFENDRSLTAKEREILLAWIDNGTPKGDDKDLPSPRPFAQGWRIGKPDVILTMEHDYTVPAAVSKNGIPYKYFFVETNFTEDRWIERAEVLAGAPEVAHHIVVYIMPANGKFFPGNPENPVLAAAVPGDMPLIFPPGTAKRIPAGAKLAFQMHYKANGRAQTDRSSVGLIFAREKPTVIVQTEPIANPLAIQIPPGDANFRADASWRFREDGIIYSFMPQMHLRGKDFMCEAVYPDGSKETLLSVPKYNFNWQSVYRLKDPLKVKKGTRINCVAHFDNSAGNPNNPDPTKKVFWGDQTSEEMMIGWLEYAYDRPAR